jgi:hypothetical protein
MKQETMEFPIIKRRDLAPQAPYLSVMDGPLQTVIGAVTT